MCRGCVEPGPGLRNAAVGLTALLAIVSTCATEAEARYHRHHHIESSYQPPYADMVVDANSGRVLHATNPDSLRHPASLTKVMTLYLLFEQIEAGRLKLDSPLRVSAHAASQNPSKLGLEPGQTIEVEDAIKAVVTKSANDVAVVIAEAVGGDEGDFAKLMTRKAHALGMSRTVYVNASGLPADDQVTTAHDQVLLGRAIQERFPRYYQYFSTASFRYHGEAMRNHNHLLGRVSGVDGIKTGYTQASGFNLITSVRRGGRHIVAVVFGGPTAGERDARMRNLIEDRIEEASVRRTAPAIVEAAAAPTPRAKPRPAAADAGTSLAAPEASSRPVPPEPAPRAVAANTASRIAMAETDIGPRVDATPTATIPITRPAPGSAEPIQPIVVKTITVKAGAIQSASLAPLVIPAPQSTMVPAQLAAPKAPPPAQPAPPASAQPAPPPPVATLPPPGARSGVLGTLPVRTTVATAGTESAPEVAALPSTPNAHESHGRGEWMIQLGAFDAEDQAKQRLRSAQSMAQDLLGKADPFTERVVKGTKEYFRARFAGFDKDKAEAACHYFKRNDIACMALKN